MHRHLTSRPVTRCFTTGIVASLASSVSLAMPGHTQFVSDKTLGAESSVLTPDGALPGGTADLIEGRAHRISNLFHSFEAFNINTGQSVGVLNVGEGQGITLFGDTVMSEGSLGAAKEVMMRCSGACSSQASRCDCVDFLRMPSSAAQTVRRAGAEYS